MFDEKTFKTIKETKTYYDQEYIVIYNDVIQKDYINLSIVYYENKYYVRHYIGDIKNPRVYQVDLFLPKLNKDSVGHIGFFGAIEEIEKHMDLKWNNQNSDMPIVAVSTKTYGDERGYPVAYRQHLAESHCRFNHGYNLKFHFEFECCELDVRNWCVDYGSLKSLKDKLDDWFDHKTLVAESDPNRKDFEELASKGLAEITFVEATGCEALARFLWDYMTEYWLPDNGYSPRVRMKRVEVRETESNMAYIER